MSRIGYARVSSREQNFDRQLDVIYEFNDESRMLELDFLSISLNEALEFIKPISEKYTNSSIGVTAVAIDDFFNAY